MNISQYHPVCLFNRSDINTIPDYNKVYKVNVGLCNQINMLINSIINGYNNNKNIFIIDTFLYCILKGEICPVEKIFNLKEMSKKISKFFGQQIIFLDRNNVNLEIVSAEYGLKNVLTVDCTQKIKEIIINSLWLNGNDFNDILKKDPLPMIRKKLYVIYKLNDYIFTEVLNETNIIINCNTDYIKTSLFNDAGGNFGVNTMYNLDIFNKLLKNIVFSEEIINSANYLENQYVGNLSYDVVHLRIEKDAIDHWSKSNNLDKKQFKSILYDKYINLIQKYCGENVFILTNYTEKAKVLLENIHKNLIYIPADAKENTSNKNLGINGREINAIIDFLIAIKKCKKFIASYNFQSMSGSTFSYIISRFVNDKVISIDLDNINNKEEILFLS